jgi:hypothetical protein
MPDWLEPMAATLTQERFAGDDWLFERKFDGIRLLAYKRGAEVRLYSRNRLLTLRLLDDRLHHGVLEVAIRVPVGRLHHQQTDDLFLGIHPEVRAERAVPSEATW